MFVSFSFVCEIVVFITVRSCITNNHDALLGSWETLFGSRWCSLCSGFDMFLIS